MKKAMWKLKNLKANNPQVCCNGKWGDARPENYKPKYCNILKRIKYAWYVITGEAETFMWPEDE